MVMRHWLKCSSCSGFKKVNRSVEGKVNCDKCEARGFIVRTRQHRERLHTSDLPKQNSK
jgi:DnaJ-class molecular chaperone